MTHWDMECKHKSTSPKGRFPSCHGLKMHLIQCLQYLIGNNKRHGWHNCGPRGPIFGSFYLFCLAKLYLYKLWWYHVQFNILQIKYLNHRREKLSNRLVYFHPWLVPLLWMSYQVCPPSHERVRTNIDPCPPKRKQMRGPTDTNSSMSFMESTSYTHYICNQIRVCTCVFMSLWNSRWESSTHWDNC